MQAWYRAMASFSDRCPAGAVPRPSTGTDTLVLPSTFWGREAGFTGSAAAGPAAARAVPAAAVRMNWRRVTGSVDMGPPVGKGPASYPAGRTGASLGLSQSRFRLV